MKDKFEGFNPKHKVEIKKIEGCNLCYIVDSIVVPHCDCKRHGGWNYSRVKPLFVVE